jgi:hypothetical protein
MSRNKISLVYQMKKLLKLKSKYLIDMYFPVFAFYSVFIIIFIINFIFNRGANLKSIEDYLVSILQSFILDLSVESIQVLCRNYVKNFMMKNFKNNVDK